MAGKKFSTHGACRCAALAGFAGMTFSWLPACAHHHGDRHMVNPAALQNYRTPEYPNTPGAEVFEPRPPHSEVVVTLPGRPGQHPHVYTVLGAIIKPHPLKPLPATRPPPTTVTEVRVHRHPERARKPAGTAEPPAPGK